MNKLKQEWTKATVTKPIVFIGAGGIIKDAHIPAYKDAGFKLHGVTDINEKSAIELVEDYGVETWYPSIETMVNKLGTSVIYDIAVPPNAIIGILEQLPNEAAVLIQKPMGATQDEARRIREICRNKKLKAAINFQLRYSPMMLAAKDAIEQGLIGELLEVDVSLNIYTPWHIFPFLIPMERVEILVHSIHYLDTIRAIAGNPSGVFARTMNDPRSPEFAQTRSSILLEYDTPIRGILNINHNHLNGQKYQDAWFRFEGTEGCIKVKLGVCYDYPNGEADELWLCKNGEDWKQVPLIGNWFTEAFKGPMTNLQRFEAGEDSILYSSIEDAYQTMALVESCFDSMKLPTSKLLLD